MEKIIESSFSSLKNKSVFLTGGTGFFGKSFLDLFIQYTEILNIKLTVLSRSPQSFLSAYPEYRHPQITWIRGDVIDFTFPETKFDIIMHFATPADAKMNINQPRLMCDTIVDGMSHILKFAQHCGCKKFLFASSGAVYGQQPADLLHVDETFIGAPSPLAQDSAYGEAKRYAELLGCMTSRQANFEFKIARCFAFVGRHLDQNGMYAIGNFISDALNNRIINIKGDGTSYRSYLYADDLIVWLLTILNQGENNQAYNVGSDKNLTIAELAHTVQKVINQDVQIKINQQSKPGAKPSRYVPSIKKAREELGLDVWTSLEEAIQKSKI